MLRAARPTGLGRRALRTLPHQRRMGHALGGESREDRLLARVSSQFCSLLQARGGGMRGRFTRGRSMVVSDGATQKTLKCSLSVHPSPLYSLGPARRRPVPRASRDSGQRRHPPRRRSVQRPGAEIPGESQRRLGDAHLRDDAQVVKVSGSNGF